MNRYYNMRSILRDITKGRDLNAEQIEYIRAKLERDAARDKQRAILRKANKESFQREIMEILETAPTTGFTATDVQFLIRDFVNRHITNQKVAANMNDLVREGKANWASINGNRMTVFYCGDSLVDLYRRYPIRSINSVYSR